VEVRADLQGPRGALAEKLKDVPAPWPPTGRRRKEGRRAEGANAPAAEIARPRRRWPVCPKDAEAAKKAWTARRRLPNAVPAAGRHAAARAAFAGDPNGDEKAQAAYDTSRATSWRWCSV
jgi:cation/acetate symporter